MDIQLHALGPWAPALQKARADKEKRAEPNTRRANFTALYKKSNLKFVQDEDAKRQGRHQTMEQHRKIRRSQRIADGRKAPITEMTNELNMMIDEDEISELQCSGVSTMSATQQLKSGKVKTSSIAEEEGEEMDKGTTGVNAVNNNDKSKSTVNNKITGLNLDQNQKPSLVPAKAGEARRLMFQKWRKEKEADVMKKKLESKQPFKVGAPVTTKGVKSTSTTGLFKGTANASTLPEQEAKKKEKATTAAFGLKAVNNDDKSKSVLNKRTASKLDQNQKPSVVPPSKSAENTSRFNFQKMKKETEAAAMKTRLENKQPSKVGVPITTKPAKIVSTSGLAKSATNAMNTRSGSQITQEVKRTTRATTAVGINAVKNDKSKSTINNKRTGLKQDQNQKPPVLSKSAEDTNRLRLQKGKKEKEASTMEARLETKQNSKVEAPMAPITTDPVESMESSHTESTTNASTPPPQQEVKKKKKAKPKAIDATYTDYNGRFSDACRKLGAFSTEWRTILEEQNESISDDIRDEIYSALGAVKLLLESKLPQFGELLYTYLCKDEDATIILACDLEGWWDVAYIQVEAVYKRFEALVTLKNNQWSKPEPPPPPTQKTKRLGSEGDAIISQSENNFPVPQRRVPKPKVQASGGLKAFLANKRKMQQQSSNTESDANITTQNNVDNGSEQPMEICLSANVTSSDSVESQPPSTLNVSLPQDQKLTLSLSLHQGDENAESNRMFEGGFFTISSPLATPTTPRERKLKLNSHSFSVDECIGASPSSSVSTFRTPIRGKRLSSLSSDASLRRASLSMLGVRRSMGTFSRIGAVPGFTEEKQDDDRD